MLKKVTKPMAINSGSIKILNDNKISTSPSQTKILSPAMSTKGINVELAKKTPQSLKSMDHYVLKTVKNEVNNKDGDIDSISFILTDEIQEGVEVADGDCDITEDFHLSGEEEDNETNRRSEDIVEHVCGKCYKTFRRFSGLKKHLDFCHFDSGYHLRKAEMLKNLPEIEEKALEMEKNDICFCCEESYDTYHLGHINCPDCPKSFKTQISYERHIFITHSENDDFPCTICNGKLRSKALLVLHFEQHQNRGKPYACKICGTDFTRSYHLKRHQKYSSCSANQQDSMSCKVCNKVFFRLDNLRNHLKQHLGTYVTKKPEYTCPICKNYFYSLSTLNIHTRTHTGERPFDCDLCEKKFPSLVALKKHRRYHTGEKPYTCSVCNQSFAVKEVLNRHMKRHTGERPHTCPDCGKGFIQATQLRNHAKTHVKPYVCEDCKESFKTVKQLARHSKIHTRRTKACSNKFNCTLCKMTYGKREQLDKHMDKQHPKPAKCTICNKTFDTSKNLDFHMLKVHEGDAEDSNNEIDIDETSSTSIEKENLSVEQDVKEEEGPAPKKLKFENSLNLEVAEDSVILQEFVVDEVSVLENQPEVPFTVIPNDNETVSIKSSSKKSEKSPIDEKKRNLRKSLARSLAAAIADQPKEQDDKRKPITKEDLKLQDNIGKLIKMLVDEPILEKLGWPKCSEEDVLRKVIENCDYDMTEISQDFEDYDYATRIREYVKIFFTAVIRNDMIKELLNNFPIDDVIEFVLDGEKFIEDEDSSGGDDKADDKN